MMLLMPSLSSGSMSSSLEMCAGCGWWWWPSWGAVPVPVPAAELKKGERKTRISVVNITTRQIGVTNVSTDQQFENSTSNKMIQKRLVGFGHFSLKVITSVLSSQLHQSSQERFANVVIRFDPQIGRFPRTSLSPPGFFLNNRSPEARIFLPSFIDGGGCATILPIHQCQLFEHPIDPEKRGSLKTAHKEWWWAEN